MTGYDGTTAMVAVVARQPSDDPGGQGEDFGKSSPWGLVVIIVFVIAVILLIRSMNKHLKRVPESFDPPADAAADAAADDRPGKGDASG